MEALADRIAACVANERPACWSGPAGESPFATDADAFDVLRGLASRWRGGDSEIVPRVFADGAPRGFHPDRHLPADRDGDLAGFLARLRRERTEGDTGMVVEDAACLSAPLFLRIQALLSRLYAQVGMFAGGAHSELFLGDYQRSFFRLHKDSLHTITFVLHGRKRLLVWPYEAFEAAHDLPEGTRHTAFTLPDEVDTRERRTAAAVLEGGPGDVFFWPASYWHMAEQVPDTGFAVTLTLALSPVAAKAPGAHFRLAARGLEDLFDDGWAPELQPLTLTDASAVSAEIVRRRDALCKLAASPNVQAAFTERVLAWLSAGGFERFPEPEEVMSLQPTDLIRADGVRRIFHAAPSGEAMPCAVNGIVLSATPDYLPLVQCVNAGIQASVQVLADRFGGPDRPLSRQEIIEALEQLAAARAFRVTRNGDRGPDPHGGP